MQNLHLDRRLVERLLSTEFDLNEICGYSNETLNRFVTFLQLINADETERSTSEVIQSLSQSRTVQSVLMPILPAQGNDDTDEQGNSLIDNPRAYSVEFGSVVLSQLGILSRTQVNILVTVLRFLLLMIGKDRS